MPEVIIDGVRYIPAKEALANEAPANEAVIARALLMQFWGECSDERLDELVSDPDVRVLVNDWGKGVPLREVLDEAARLAKEEGA